MPATVTDEEVQKLNDWIVNRIKQTGGKVEVEKFGRRTFAYPIKKHTIGDYWIVRYMSEDNKLVKDIETKLKYQENVLRYMTVKVPKKYFKEIKEIEDGESE